MDIESEIRETYRKGDFKKAADTIRDIADPCERFKQCFNAVLGHALDKMMAEYGKIMIYNQRDKYEEAKRGMADISPHAALLNEDDLVDIKDMLDFVPDDNPIKQLFYELLPK